MQGFNQSEKDTQISLLIHNYSGQNLKQKEFVYKLKLSLFELKRMIQMFQLDQVVQKFVFKTFSIKSFLRISEKAELILKKIFNKANSTVQFNYHLSWSCLNIQPCVAFIFTYLKSKNKTVVLTKYQLQLLLFEDYQLYKKMIAELESWKLILI
ncbi:unnamed protein product [Paramecium octaurelia]|uniref:Uncharacterized protein n=1 Tax=Paramecium octaurelia TaxID=43137 RepID=A0A8S1VIX2_PAROT|nr:unnamed protein product [Paramecium octaurelia]